MHRSFLGVRGMFAAVLLFGGTFVLLDAACGGSSQPNPVTGGSSGTGGAPENDSGPTEDAASSTTKHYGCAELTRSDCVGTTEAECTKNPECSFQYNRCLPKGGGCRDVKTNRRDCELAGNACRWTGFEGMGGMGGGPSVPECLDRCSFRNNYRSCIEQDACSWSQNDQYCRTKTNLKCTYGLSEEECGKDPACEWLPSRCEEKAPCWEQRTESACKEAPGCRWQTFGPMDKEGGMCDSACYVNSKDQEDCEKVEGCTWDMYMCFPKWQRECQMTPYSECGSKKECKAIGICQPGVRCPELSPEDCEKHEDCQGPRCEHVCTLHRSEKLCTGDDACQWIAIEYDPGQRCNTACHSSNKVNEK